MTLSQTIGLRFRLSEVNAKKNHGKKGYNKQTYLMRVMAERVAAPTKPYFPRPMIERVRVFQYCDGFDVDEFSREAFRVVEFLGLYD